LSDPVTQRSTLEKIEQLTLTPTSFAPLVMAALADDPEFQVLSTELNANEGSRRFLVLAYTQPASLLDYLPENTLIAIDEPEQCHAHSDRWVENAEEQWVLLGKVPRIHRTYGECLTALGTWQRVYLSELAEENSGMNLASRSIPVTPHQFAKLADIIRQERDRHFTVWLISAQPSRSVSLLQEHDCPAQFIPNPRDYQAIDRILDFGFWIRNSCIRNLKSKIQNCLTGKAWDNTKNKVRKAIRKLAVDLLKLYAARWRSRSVS